MPHKPTKPASINALKICNAVVYSIALIVIVLDLFVWRP